MLKCLISAFCCMNYNNMNEQVKYTYLVYVMWVDDDDDDDYKASINIYISSLIIFICFSIEQSLYELLSGMYISCCCFFFLVYHEIIGEEF